MERGRAYMNTSSLMIYHIKKHKKEKQVTGLCRRLGIRTRALKASDGNLEVGMLAGIGRAGSGVHQKAPMDWQLPDILIFSGFPDELLDTFLSEYKKSGIEPTGLKSVVTPHNLTWTVYELAAELVRERTAMLLGGGQIR